MTSSSSPYYPGDLDPRSALKRVRTRPETPSPLTILATVCSSPSVRWDGVKHRYGEGRGKSIWCEDLRAARGPSYRTRIVDPSSSKSPLPDREHTLGLQDMLREDMDDYAVTSAGKEPTADDMYFPNFKEIDDDIRTPKLSVDHDYHSDDSSPPALIFSSPLRRMSCDSSSPSERLSTLSPSSPDTYQRDPSCMPLAGSEHHNHSENSADTFFWTTSGSPFLKGQNDAISVPPIHEDSLAESTLVEEQTSSDTSKTVKRDLIRPPSLSPLSAPGPLPQVSLGFQISPLSSLVSSPLSEAMDEDPLSLATATSNLGDALSTRSAGPLHDSDPFTQPKGSRGSPVSVGTSLRWMSGVSDSIYLDTSPPQSTTNSRSPGISPSSATHPLGSCLSSLPPPPSPHSIHADRSSVAPGEQRPSSKRLGRKIQSARASKSSKTRRSTEPPTFHPHPPSKRGKRGPSTRQPDTPPPCTDTTPSEFDALSVAELTTLPMTGFLVETLALSRASAMTTPELLRAVLKSQPHVLEERPENIWLELVRCILKNVRMFGRIERKGTDAADKPLEDEWFYIPENDDESGRAELLRELMPQKRDVTKRSKQYYFQPVRKITRWDTEDD